LDFDSGSPGPTRVRYRIVEPLPGASLIARVDGQVAQKFLTASAGAWDLPHGDADSDTLELSVTDVGGADVYVDRKPLARGKLPVFRMRTVHRVTKGGIFVPVHRHGSESSVVNMVVYAPGRRSTAGIRVSLTIDGGEPRRITGAPVERITATRRRMTVTGSQSTEIVWLNREGSRTAATAVIPIVVGGDIAPGRHVVRVDVEGYWPVWVRFFRSGRDPSVQDVTRWKRVSEELPGDD
jgi:hypothetical protein